MLSQKHFLRTGFHHVTLKVMIMASLPLALLFGFYLLSQWGESHNLIAATSQVSTQSIRSLYTDHIRERSHGLVREMELKFQLMENELAIVARTAQHLIDTPELAGLGRQLRQSQHPYFSDQFTYQSTLGYSVNSKGSHDTSVNLNQLLHEGPKQLKPQVQKYIDLYSPMKLILPMVQRYGIDKEWLYVVGPHKAAIDMVTPWIDTVKASEKTFPAYNTGNYWEHSLNGILQSWNKWIEQQDDQPIAPLHQKSTHETTWSSLYDDVFGQGKMITLYRPLWSRDRRKIEGGVGVDYKLSHIINWLVQKGSDPQNFAFLVRNDSSVLGVPSDKYPLLGLVDADPNKQQDFSAIEYRYLNKSWFQPIQTLANRLNDHAPFMMTSFIGANDKEYLLSLGRIRSFNQMDGSIRPEFWFIGILTATDELVTLQSDLSHTIKSRFDDTLTLTLLISIALFLVTLLLTGYFSFRATRQIRFLNEGVEAIKHKKWHYRVDIVSNDELGDLGITFNQLTSQLKESYEKLESYTKDLESKVAERTKNLEASNRKLQELAEIDSLTKLYNRLYFDAFFDKSWRMLGRKKQPLSIILIDVDLFKQYNDTYGHQKGDECLKAIATVLKQKVSRASECLARYGGEEFIITLHQNRLETTRVAAQLRALVAELNIPHASSTKGFVSISLGISTCVPSHQYAPAQLINMADKALYISKKKGRDQVNFVDIDGSDPTLKYIIH